METTTSKLILGFYVAVTLVVVIIGLVFYQAGRVVPKSEVLPGDRAVASRPAKPLAESTALSKQLRLDIERQRERIRELQQLLDKRETVLQQQKQLLETKSEESRRLQDEADRYLELLMQLVDESAESMDENLNMLRFAEDQADASGSPPTIASLEAALMAAEWELEQAAQTSAASERALSEQTLQLTGLQSTIVAAGDSALPILVSLMSEQQHPELRAWSATALGPLASRSPMAMDALLIAADDIDESVRNAARRAIQEATDRQ